MIVFNENLKSVFVGLGYGSCGIGKSVCADEPCVIIDKNDEGSAVGEHLGLSDAELSFQSVVISFPTEAQRDAVYDAIFRFKQDQDGNWFDGTFTPKSP